MKRCSNKLAEVQPRRRRADQSIVRLELRQHSHDNQETRCLRTLITGCSNAQTFLQAALVLTLRREWRRWHPRFQLLPTWTQQLRGRHSWPASREICVSPSCCSSRYQGSGRVAPQIGVDESLGMISRASPPQRRQGGVGLDQRGAFRRKILGCVLRSCDRACDRD